MADQRGSGIDSVVANLAAAGGAGLTLGLGGLFLPLGGFGVIVCSTGFVAGLLVSALAALRLSATRGGRRKANPSRRAPGPRDAG
ncbi:MAG: hypothetical protein WC876_07525 [Candidatus Thermoplasmatota archaeon]